jgi:hypothetical protein
MGRRLRWELVAPLAALHGLDDPDRLVALLLVIQDRVPGAL